MGVNSEPQKYASPVAQRPRWAATSSKTCQRVLHQALPDLVVRSMAHPTLHGHKGIPKNVVRRWSKDGDCLPLHGVDEVNPAGVQMDGSVVVGPARAVLHIALDGASELRHGGPNLVVPSRFGEDLDKGVVV